MAGKWFGKVLNTRLRESTERVEVGDRRLESVEVVKYLGIKISGDGRMEEEIRSRIGKAARV